MRNTERVLNRLSLSGLAATLVGNGIGRFAYIALMPVLIGQQWFTPNEAAVLGGATLVGYLAGVPLAGRLTRRWKVSVLIRAALLICSVSYLACAWRGQGFLAFCGWRLLAGVGGALAMVLVPNLVIQRSGPEFRGRASGVVFAGVGTGVMASGTLVPLCVGLGVSATWLVLGGLCLMLTAGTWRTWREPAADQPGSPAAAPGMAPSFAEPPQWPKSLTWPVGGLWLGYALNAVGYLPHALFWVDYITRELGQPLVVGGMFWGIFGLAAAVGPFVTGPLADRMGFGRTLTAAYVLKTLGAALPLWDHSWIALGVSSALMGLCTPGISALVSGYTMALVGRAWHRRAWGWMTFAFAAAQVAAGGWMIVLVRQQESYHPLFLLSTGALLLSTALAAVLGWSRRDRA